MSNKPNTLNEGKFLGGKTSQIKDSSLPVQGVNNWQLASPAAQSTGGESSKPTTTAVGQPINTSTQGHSPSAMAVASSSTSGQSKVKMFPGGLLSKLHAAKQSQNTTLQGPQQEQKPGSFEKVKDSPSRQPNFNREMYHSFQDQEKTFFLNTNKGAIFKLITSVAKGTAKHIREGNLPTKDTYSEVVSRYIKSVADPLSGKFDNLNVVQSIQIPKPKSQMTHINDDDQDHKKNQSNEEAIDKTEVAENEEEEEKLNGSDSDQSLSEEELSRDNTTHLAQDECSSRELIEKHYEEECQKIFIEIEKKLFLAKRCTVNLGNSAKESAKCSTGVKSKFNRYTRNTPDEIVKKSDLLARSTAKEYEHLVIMSSNLQETEIEEEQARFIDKLLEESQNVTSILNNVKESEDKTVLVSSTKSLQLGYLSVLKSLEINKLFEKISSVETQRRMQVLNDLTAILVKEQITDTTVYEYKNKLIATCTQTLSLYSLLFSSIRIIILQKVDKSVFKEENRKTGINTRSRRSHRKNILTLDRVFKKTENDIAIAVESNKDIPLDSLSSELRRQVEKTKKDSQTELKELYLRVSASKREEEGEDNSDIVIVDPSKDDDNSFTPLLLDVNNKSEDLVKNKEFEIQLTSKMRLVPTKDVLNRMGVAKVQPVLRINVDGLADEVNVVVEKMETERNHLMTHEQRVDGTTALYKVTVFIPTKWDDASASEAMTSISNSTKNSILNNEKSLTFTVTMKEIRTLPHSLIMSYLTTGENNLRPITSEKGGIYTPDFYRMSKEFNLLFELKTSEIPGKATHKFCEAVLSYKRAFPDWFHYGMSVTPDQICFNSNLLLGPKNDQPLAYKTIAALHKIGIEVQKLTSCFSSYLQTPEIKNYKLPSQNEWNPLTISQQDIDIYNQLNCFTEADDNLNKILCSEVKKKTTARPELSDPLGKKKHNKQQNCSHEPLMSFKKEHVYSDPREIDSKVINSFPLLKFILSTDVMEKKGNPNIIIPEEVIVKDITSNMSLYEQDLLSGLLYSHFVIKEPQSNPHNPKTMNGNDRVGERDPLLRNLEHGPQRGTTIPVLKDSKLYREMMEKRSVKYRESHGIQKLSFFDFVRSGGLNDFYKEISQEGEWVLETTQESTQKRYTLHGSKEKWFQEVLHTDQLSAILSQNMKVYGGFVVKKLPDFPVYVISRSFGVNNGLQYKLLAKGTPSVYTDHWTEVDSGWFYSRHVFTFTAADSRHWLTRCEKLSNLRIFIDSYFSDLPCPYQPEMSQKDVIFSFLYLCGLNMTQKLIDDLSLSRYAISEATCLTKDPFKVFSKVTEVTRSTQEAWWHDMLFETCHLAEQGKEVIPMTLEQAPFSQILQVFYSHFVQLFPAKDNFNKTVGIIQKTFGYEEKLIPNHIEMAKVEKKKMSALLKHSSFDSTKEFGKNMFCEKTLASSARRLARLIEKSQTNILARISNALNEVTYSSLTTTKRSMQVLRNKSLKGDTKDLVSSYYQISKTLSDRVKKVIERYEEKFNGMAPSDASEEMKMLDEELNKFVRENTEYFVKRTYCIFNFIQNGKSIRSPTEIINEIMEDAIKNPPVIGIFAKEQATGEREIFILEFVWRVLILLNETIWKEVAKCLPNETISRPNIKSEAMVEQQKWITNKRMEGNTVIELCSSSDLAKFSQNLTYSMFMCFACAFFSELEKTTIQKTLDHTQISGLTLTTVKNLVITTLAHLSEKKIEVPNTIANFVFRENNLPNIGPKEVNAIRNAVKNHDNKKEDLVRLLTVDNPRYNPIDKLYTLPSGMMQGIMQVFASVMHASFLDWCCENTKNILENTLSKIGENLEFSVKVVSLCSSDDSCVRIAISFSRKRIIIKKSFPKNQKSKDAKANEHMNDDDSDEESSEAEKEENQEKEKIKTNIAFNCMIDNALASLIAKDIEKSLLNIEKVKFLVGMIPSYEKSTIGTCYPEFNSTWYLGSRAVTPFIKDTVAYLEGVAGNTASERYQTHCSAISQAFANGLPLRICHNMAACGKRLIEKLSLGLKYEKLKVKLHELNEPAIHFIPLFDVTVSSILPMSLQMFMLLSGNFGKIPILTQKHHVFDDVFKRDSASVRVVSGAAAAEMRRALGIDVEKINEDLLNNIELLREMIADPASNPLLDAKLKLCNPSVTNSLTFTDMTRINASRCFSHEIQVFGKNACEFLKEQGVKPTDLSERKGPVMSKKTKAIFAGLKIDTFILEDVMDKLLDIHSGKTKLGKKYMENRQTTIPEAVKTIVDEVCVFLSSMTSYRPVHKEKFTIDQLYTYDLKFATESALFSQLAKETFSKAIVTDSRKELFSELSKQVDGFGDTLESTLEKKVFSPTDIIGICNRNPKSIKMPYRSSCGYLSLTDALFSNIEGSYDFKQKLAKRVEYSISTNQEDSKKRKKDLIKEVEERELLLQSTILLTYGDFFSYAQQKLIVDYLSELSDSMIQENSFLSKRLLVSLYIIIKTVKREHEKINKPGKRNYNLFEKIDLLTNKIDDHMKGVGLSSLFPRNKTTNINLSNGHSLRVMNSCVVYCTKDTIFCPLDKAPQELKVMYKNTIETMQLEGLHLESMSCEITGTFVRCYLRVNISECHARFPIFTLGMRRYKEMNRLSELLSTTFITTDKYQEVSYPERVMWNNKDRNYLVGYFSGLIRSFFGVKTTPIQYMSPEMTDTERTPEFKTQRDRQFWERSIESWRKSIEMKPFLRGVAIKNWVKVLSALESKQVKAEDIGSKVETMIETERKNEKIEGAYAFFLKEETENPQYLFSRSIDSYRLLLSNKETAETQSSAEDDDEAVYDEKQELMASILEHRDIGDDKTADEMMKRLQTLIDKEKLEKVDRYTKKSELLSDDQEEILKMIMNEIVSESLKENTNSNSSRAHLVKFYGRDNRKEKILLEEDFFEEEQSFIHSDFGNPLANKSFQDFLSIMEKPTVDIPVNKATQADIEMKIKQNFPIRVTQCEVPAFEVPDEDSLTLRNTKHKGDPLKIATFEDLVTKQKRLKLDLFRTIYSPILSSKGKIPVSSCLNQYCLDGIFEIDFKRVIEGKNSFEFQEQTIARETQLCDTDVINILITTLLNSSTDETIELFNLLISELKKTGKPQYEFFFLCQERAFNLTIKEDTIVMTVELVGEKTKFLLSKMNDRNLVVNLLIPPMSSTANFSFKTV